MKILTISELKELVKSERDYAKRHFFQKSKPINTKVESITKNTIALDCPKGTFNPGDVVGYLRKSGIMEEIGNLGIVITYERENDELVLYLIGDPPVGENEELTIFKSEPLIGYNVQLGILDKIKEGNLSDREREIADLVFKKKKRLPEAKSEKRLENKKLLNKDVKLDNSQIEAVECITSLNDHELLLVIGPPGTGKTEVIAKAAYELFKQGERVLICSHTNRAVDNALEKLPVENTLRVAAKPEKVLPRLRKYMLSYKARTHLGDDLKKIEGEIKKLKKSVKAGWGQYKEYKGKEWASKRKQFRKNINSLTKELGKKLKKRNEMLMAVSNSLIMKSQIIGTTLIKSQLPPLENIEFDVVLIDECSMTTIPLALLGMLKARKCVLVGDHHQLMPILQSISRKNWERQRRIQERTSSFNYLQQKYKNRKKWLKQHYRSNKQIIGFSANAVYNHKIEAHESCADINLSLDLEKFSQLDSSEKDLLAPNQPVAFVHVEGKEKRESERSGSKYNKSEVIVCTKIVRMLNQVGIPKNKVGVIAPYRAQRNELRDQGELKNGNIEVSTIDAFQGRQKEVIIVSVTSTSNMKFISDPHRLNVALTRPISKLIVVGNGKAILKNADKNYLIYKFLKYANKKHGIFDWEKNKWISSI